MEYKCKTIPIDKLIATPKGFIMPLCQDCTTIDCENPIEKRKISFVGIKKMVKIFSRGSQVGFVVNCNGYTNR